MIRKYSGTILSGLWLIASQSYAGEMGAVATTPLTNYFAVSGGYFSSDYLAQYFTYPSSGNTERKTFNNVSNGGYGQLSLGRMDHIGSLNFDHQVVVSKLWGNETFATAWETHVSNWTFHQAVDFGYDWMPKISFFQRLEGLAILGVHYGFFNYKKLPADPAATVTNFNHNVDQIGFNLGAGINYQINSQIVVGVKYQHWQYNQATIHATNDSGTFSLTEQLTPVFNMVGAEIRYYFS